MSRSFPRKKNTHKTSVPSKPARRSNARPFAGGSPSRGHPSILRNETDTGSDMPPRRESREAACAEDGLLLPRVRPEILAPAGDMQAALAGLAAGADALYLGLKHFSARMQAENFSTSELAALTELAHKEGRRIYVAMNTLVKPSEPPQAFRLVRRLALGARPDALIIQDPAMLDIARQAGFEGELHLSTLANVTHQAALRAAREAGAARVIVPRELSLDEVRAMNASCPEKLDLEIFVHGALCYCVSGRCWWSSYMGGKSGLRGRCVQPCRRVYKQKGREGRFFSCLDLSLDVLTRELLGLENMRSWKIEGRKKGPHYVYYVTSAYKLLRDEPDNPEARREAVRLVGMALGRQSTRALFSDGAQPVAPVSRDAQTSSGLLCGRISQGEDKRYSIRPRLELITGDYLRVGYEDEPWHCTMSVPLRAKEGEPYRLVLPPRKYPKAGTPVFLIDRKEPQLMATLANWKQALQKLLVKGVVKEDVSGLYPSMPEPLRARGSGQKKLDIRLLSSLPHGREGKSGLRAGAMQGLWLSPKALREVSRTLYGRISWWLPPVIWPDEEKTWNALIVAALRGGGRHFVCNSPWQAAFFRNASEVFLTAGPFCNLANAFALGLMRKMGFAGAIVSPELAKDDLLSLPGQSPLPLGIVLTGFWPAGLTRHRAVALKAQDGFQSPKGEDFWMRRYGQNTWIYPAWPMDLSEHRQVLERAGYSTFVHMEEHPPKSLAPATRNSEFNWNAGLL